MRSWKLIKREWWVLAAIGMAAIVLYGGVALMAAPPYFWRTAEAQVATSTRLTLQPGAVSEGAIGEFQLIADVFPSGMSGLQLSVQPVDPMVAEVIGFITPGYGIVREATSTDSGGLQLFIADLQRLVQLGEADFLLATVRIQGLAVGATQFNVSIFRADDDDGFPIQFFGIGATITVVTERDLDGDGLTEDFNGNGRFDFGDVGALFDLLIASPPP